MLWNPIPLWRGVLWRRGTGYTYTKPAQIRVHVHLCCCTNNVSRLIHPIYIVFHLWLTSFLGGTPLIKKANRGVIHRCPKTAGWCCILISSQLLHIPGTQMTVVLIGKDIVLECCWRLQPPKWIANICIYIYRRTYLYMCIMLIYTMFSPYPKTPPLEFAASTAKAKFESWKPSSVGVHPIGKVNQTIGQCEKTTEDANEASCICILIYCICTMCFFLARSECVCIYHEWTLWMKPRFCIKMMSYLVSKLAVIVHVCSQVSP